MLKIKSYVKVKSIAEAYELNQKKTALCSWRYGLAENGKSEIFPQQLIFPAWVWIRVQETDDEFVIGCMTPLRENWK